MTEFIEITRVLKYSDASLTKIRYSVCGKLHGVIFVVDCDGKNYQLNFKERFTGTENVDILNAVNSWFIKHHISFEAEK